MASSRRRERINAALRKQAARSLESVLQTSGDQVQQVTAGVRTVATQIVDLVQPGSLWWVAPLQFVAEQLSVRVCKYRDIPMERVDDVAAYLLGALQEYMHALVSDFDMEHFEAWTAALTAKEGGAGSESAT